MIRAILLASATVTTCAVCEPASVRATNSLGRREHSALGSPSMARRIAHKTEVARFPRSTLRRRARLLHPSHDRLAQCCSMQLETLGGSRRRPHSRALNLQPSGGLIMRRNWHALGRLLLVAQKSAQRAFDRLSTRHAADQLKRVVRIRFSGLPAGNIDQQLG
jgi:hypothetical protein